MDLFDLSNQMISELDAVALTLDARDSNLTIDGSATMCGCSSSCSGGCAGGCNGPCAGACGSN